MRIGLIDAKDMDESRPVWISGCPISNVISEIKKTHLVLVKLMVFKVLCTKNRYSIPYFYSMFHEF